MRTKTSINPKKGWAALILVLLEIHSIQAAPGEVDLSFQTPLQGTMVQSLALQPDGKILIVGIFSAINGTNRNCIARLNNDGSLDTSFDPGIGPSSNPWSVALQGSQVIVGGPFPQFNWLTHKCIARLNSDGSLDNGFDAQVDKNVRSIAAQADGKLVIGGQFTNVNSVLRNRVARLNADGTLDDSFDPGWGANDYVNAVAIDPVDRVLIGGWFTLVNSNGWNHLARLNSNGSIDTSFNTGFGADNFVQCLAVQKDGKILIGGAFTHFNGTPKNYLARLNENGNLDTTFNASADYAVVSLAVQPDGRVLAGGMFTNMNGVIRPCLARLNADGSLDNSFNPPGGANGWVYSLGVQVDGKVVASGWFTSIGAVNRTYLARLIGGGNSVPASIPLLAQKAGDSLVLTWADPTFDLQFAPSVTGTFTTITGASSPYTNSSSSSQGYFRLRSR